MKYKVIQSKDGKFVAEMFDDTNFLDNMRLQGFEVVGHASGLAPYLCGRPCFEEFHGPMGDNESGEPVVRYEDWPTSNALSD